MSPSFVRSGSLLAFIAALTTVTFLPSAENSLTTEPANNEKTDWKQYTTVGSPMCEVRDSSETSVKVRLYWMAPGKEGAKPTADQIREKNDRRVNKILTNIDRFFMGKQSALTTNVKIGQVRAEAIADSHEEHADYNFGCFPDTSLKAAKGFANPPSTISSLAPGTVVTVTIVRDKSIPQNALKETDLKLKTILAMGPNPNYKADDKPGTEVNQMVANNPAAEKAKKPAKKAPAPKRQPKNKAPQQ